jgi:pyruvate,orthophosphate dikinase
MAKAAGILTSRGGLTSHAAVVARGWGIPAVVGTTSVEVGENSVVIAGRRFSVGETITIDGGTGEVFEGEVCGACEIVPEAATLLRWARELGIAIPEGESEGPAGPAASETPTNAAVAATTDDVLRGLLVKGQSSLESLGQALLVAVDELQPLIDTASAAGLVESASGAIRLTAEGKLAAYEVIAAERERWGAENAEGALEGFLPLDHRMKDTVTAWQVREIGGESTFNDHSDAAYDASVLAGLSALHDDAVELLGTLARGLGRMEAYRVRLDQALSLARAGDQRYVASPRVESYHTVWFELHEDLIRLSGRKRSEEVAQGRA